MVARSLAVSSPFQVATLVGAGSAVQLAPAPKPGFTAASAALLVAGLTYGFKRRLSLRAQASRALLGEHAPAVERALPNALLAEAERLASLGAYRMAVVVAESAVDVLVERQPQLGRLTLGTENLAKRWANGSERSVAQTNNRRPMS